MKYLKMMSVLILALTMVNCSDDDDPKAPTADFFYDVNGTEVTFTSETSGVDTWEWIFGDGNSSTEKNPVHAYETPGTYKVTLRVSGAGGIAVVPPKDVVVEESMEYLLTGGAAKTEGKTWKLKWEGSDIQGIGGVENALTIQLPLDSDGFFSDLGLPQSYNDTFTFIYDGSYKVDNSADNGGSLMSYLYAANNYTMTPVPDGHITGISNDLNFAPVVDILYSPKEDATWGFSEESFNVDAALLKQDGTIESKYTMEFKGHIRLVLDEYFAFKDANNIVIIKEISEDEFTVAIALNAAIEDGTLATQMIHLTFVAVN